MTVSPATKLSLSVPPELPLLTYLPYNVLRSGFVISKPAAESTVCIIKLDDACCTKPLANSEMVYNSALVFLSSSLMYSVFLMLKEQPSTIDPSLTTTSPNFSIWFCKILCSCVNSRA